MPSAALSVLPSAPIRPLPPSPLRLPARLRLRAFRAVEDRETAERFARGHRKALAARGVRRLSSAHRSWIANPSVYAIVLECPSSGRVFAGARVHLAGGAGRLPLEEAIGDRDSRVHGAIRASGADRRFPAAELCGVWKTAADRQGSLSAAVREMALLQIALARGLGVRRGWGFSPEHTLGFWRSLGFRVERSLGEDGAFLYPDARFISRVVVIDLERLEGIAARDRRRIAEHLGRPEDARTIAAGGSGPDLEIDLSVLGRHARGASRGGAR